MDLSQKERDVASCLQLGADRPLAEIAKESGYKVHTVRYVLNSLLERGILRPYTLIDFYPLGLIDFIIFCSATFKRESEREKFIRFLVKCPEVSWISEVGGEHQYGISICARRPEEVELFLHSVGRNIGDVLIEKKIATCLRWTLFRRKYLSSVASKITQLSVGYQGQREDIDQTDQQILAYLCENPLSTQRDLAQHIGTSSSTIEYRMKALRRKHILVGTVYSIEAEKFGFIPFRFHISLRGIHPNHRTALFDFCKKNLYVTSFVECMGEWDLSLRVEVPSSLAAIALQRQFYDSFPAAIAHVQVLPVVTEHKFSGFPLLRGEDWKR
jgi:DNA-binding Lrp family transcriptional regulator